MNQTIKELDSVRSNLQGTYLIPEDDKREILRLRQVVQKNGVLNFNNLPIVKGEEVEMLLLFGTKPQPTKKKRLTVRDLLDSDLVGMWEDRTDITDSSVYARQLREQAQTRNHDYPRQ